MSHRLRVVFLAMSLLGSVLMAVPPQINYQGRLIDGTNLVQGSVDLVTRLFNVSTLGSSLYVDSNDVVVVDGLYDTIIGDGTVSGNLQTALTNEHVWIELEVNGVVLTPRERIASVPFALKTDGVEISPQQSVVINGRDGSNTVGQASRFSVVSGGFENSIQDHTDYSFVGGGQKNRAGGNWSTISGGWTNRADGTYSTVSGGERNIADGESSAVVGGRFNNALGTISIVGGEGNWAGDYAIALGLDNRAMSYASGIFSGDDNTITNTEYAVIVGGQHNEILSATEYSGIFAGFENIVGPTGLFSVVIGGYSNRAAGNGSFAAGNRARALHDGSFVWGDQRDENVFSTTSNQVTYRSTGGFRVLSGGGTNTGVEVAPGSGSWTSLSDVHAKKNIRPVNDQLILEHLMTVPVYTWSYKAQSDSVRHIGPTAQDFNRAFDVGDKPTGITTVDADGVALAAIRALAKENEALREELDALKRQVDDLMDVSVVDDAPAR